MKATKTAAASLLGLIVVLGLGGQGRAETRDSAANIRGLIVELTSEADKARRYEIGDKLQKLVEGLDRRERENFAPELIDNIATLLRDHDDIIRTYAAEVLANVGVPAALRAVGPLLKALREAKSNPSLVYRGASYNATDAIIGALHKMQVCIVPPERHDRDVCDYLLQ
ncbi:MULTISPECIES: hypothetical protein [unclassified Bradyrhizobium]|uniref:hypothetical protein n=1 Tax=unclassified Bradyrhizobium TaxID=2631580 RepID=UPI0028E62B4E|nr:MULTISPECIES: hypothetical protein [unclassified Bradyrhizobium]